MAKFSKVFGINKSQSELDFVDIPVDTDVWLFIDPFAIGQRSDALSQKCHLTLVSFFQRVVESIRSGREEEAKRLLQNLREPNETRLGLSSNRPSGAGIGPFQAQQLYEALKNSSAVKTGFLSSLEECELMIEGIGKDKISDLTTNIIRGHLVNYTQEQCELHNVPIRSVALPPCFNADSMEWESKYLAVPVWNNKPIVLVPKVMVRFDPAYDHRRYYRHFVLDYLQAEALRASSSLARTLKNGKRVVYKKDLESKFPCSKEFLYNFSREHPEVLQAYREELERLEKNGPASVIDTNDESFIARALATALQSIPTGPAHAGQYHSLMIGIVEFLFFPQLLSPKKEREIHEGRKRIDILMENGSRDGIFFRLHNVRKLPCAFVPIECKNYTTEVSNPELDQLGGRFSINRGKVGLLCCRQFEDRALFIQRCKDTLADDRGLIVPLDDQRIMGLLDLIQNGQRTKLDSELAKLVDEVWL